MTYELSFVFLLERGQKGAAELCGNWVAFFWVNISNDTEQGRHLLNQYS